MGTRGVIQWSIAFIGLLVVFIVPANGISCYQCTSTNSSSPFQCSENLSSDTDLKATPCSDVYGAKFCLKHVGRFEGGVGTKRMCSSVNLGNTCSYDLGQPGDTLKYRTCVYTCSTDGCNPASTHLPNVITIVALTLAIIYFFRR
ncbi:glycosylphosphatidylinositol anchored membrane protein boudin isoform X2 [Cotesia typhae]|uniref:glycosylphosphatidylinositol anchored membrane protein boudin isoform X2 n=1 Tax=Cotesia typhae TaxID=2053667 RepID=UPI003D682429